LGLQGGELGVDLLPPASLRSPLGLDAPRFHRRHGRSQVQARQPLDALGFQAAVVDPDLKAGLFQRRVGLLRPGFPGCL